MLLGGHLVFIVFLFLPVWPIDYHIMPYQSAFTLLIIGGAFSAAACLIGGLNYVAEGKTRRSLHSSDYWAHQMEQRDAVVKKLLSEKNKN